ncbi:MAG: MarR family winged helix-turn-helix transcriptional regulator [Henriciella sp.]|uniref:MarR family winged helix-turn-helix transcriptional regulator n=1 Tax=Henriciella sp. TaxID=1968823 RepID=UPI003C764CFE
MRNPYLIVTLLEAFEWYDECLQLSMQSLGWPELSRSESMVMMHVQLNNVRPADIARSLRLTRQAVHHTIGALVDRGILELVDDPTDGRVRIVQLTELGRAMRRDARKIVNGLGKVLGDKIGDAEFEHLRSILQREWGPPVIVREGTGPGKKYQEDFASAEGASLKRNSRSGRGSKRGVRRKIS